MGGTALILEEAAGELITGAVTMGQAGLATASPFGPTLVSARPALVPRLL